MEDVQLLTRAEWARERGFSKAYASKLVKRGKVVLVDGKIDPVDAARRLAAQQNPLKQAQKLTFATELTELTKWGATSVGKLTDLPSSDPEGHQVRSDEIDAKLLPEELLRARIKTEREAGRIKELERRKKELELVDAEEVRDAQVRRASEEREALLNWPPRVAALMAAELQIEESRFLPVLRKYVRQHLAERSKRDS